MVIFLLSSDRNTAKYFRKCFGCNLTENYGLYNGRKLFRSHTRRSSSIMAPLFSQFLRLSSSFQFFMGKDDFDALQRGNLLLGWWWRRWKWIEERSIKVQQQQKQHRQKRKKEEVLFPSHVETKSMDGLFDVEEAAKRARKNWTARRACSVFTLLSRTQRRIIYLAAQVLIIA